MSAEILKLLASIKAELHFDEAKHAYTREGETLVSVTQAIDGALAKPVLIPWASKIQHEADVEVVKNWIATSLPATAFSPQNIQILFRSLDSKKQAWKKESGEAKDIGSEAHLLIEHESKVMLGIESKEPQVSDAAYYVFSGWKEWAKETGFKPIAAEARVYHKVYGYAGTIDAIASFRDIPLAIVDYKSSNSIYESHTLQIEAYQAAVLSHGFPMETTGLIVRLPKSKPEKPEVRWVPHSDEGRNAFLGLLTTYRWLHHTP